jgi:hypothetical protein
VPKLPRFNAPAGLADPEPNAWNARVNEILAPYLDGSLPHFYNPTQENTPAHTPEPMVSWVAFPASLRTGTPTDRLRIADGDRTKQDEYCEWTVTRNTTHKITRVTFTTELPEYWEHLFKTAPLRVVQLYRKLVDPRVELRDLHTAKGKYRRENLWNTSTPGRLAHLMQDNNTLEAAVDLVAEATVLRSKGGQPVTNQQELVRCAGLGNPFRHSDPQIASAVNVAVTQASEIALSDPPGLYLGRPLTAGMVTPDGADAAKFWKIERGDPEHTVRARFEVPPNRGYVVGDIEIGGRPIQHGGQIAQRVQVWVKVLVRAGKHAPQPKPCGA